VLEGTGVLELAALAGAGVLPQAARELRSARSILGIELGAERLAMRIESGEFAFANQEGGDGQGH
jgi:hypothetical protein